MKEKNLSENENEYDNNRIQKRNYSESPTMKKNYFATENTKIDYSTKSNANIYKRNNSSHLNTISNKNNNNQFNEETIELIIPTPYPKNVFNI